MTDQPAERTLAQLFASAVASAPTKTFLAMEDTRLNFQQVDDWSRAVAGGLAASGVSAGDVVVLVATNHPEVVVTWLACLHIGACFAPLNVGFTSAQLASLFERVRPAVVIAEPGYLDAIDAAISKAVSDPSRFVLRGTGHGWLPWSSLEREGLIKPGVVGRSSDLAAILCTSGTTGASKAVALTNRWFTKICESNERYWGFRNSDTFYCPFPLYHMDAMAMTVAAGIYHSTTAAIARRFSVRGFWDDVRRYDATVFDFLGTTLSLLWKEPARAEDRENPARLGWGVPMPEFQAGFEQRFGCTLVDCYGSTDVGIPIYGTPGDAKPAGSCGRVVEGYRVAILDDEGRVLEPGQTGEISIRPNEPNIIMEGYVGDPEATRQTWRGLWHHTGDLGTIDSEGYVYFLGRAQDYIRRRGENISVAELETEAARHPDLVAVAAVGVPSELTEEDIKIVAVCRADSGLTPADLGSWLRSRLPRYMTVRYVELVQSLPTTDTAKVRHRDLVADWNNPSTWDLERDRYLS